MPIPQNRFLLLTAWLSVGLHALGLLFAVIGMRPGTPAFELESRLQYLAGRPLLWTAGWAIWMLCALALIANLAALSRFIQSQTLGVVAIALASAGAAIDLTCDLIYILILPKLAGQGAHAQLTFEAFERLAGAAGIVVANGFYVIAILLITIGLREGRETPALHKVPSAVIALGYGTFLFGLCMSVAGFTGVSWHLEYATGPAIGCFMLWQLGAAYALTRTPAP